MSLLDKPRCGTCFWWHAGKPIYAARESDPGEPALYLGTCMLRPPVLIGTDPDRARSMFPVVHAERCCSYWESADDPPGAGAPPQAMPVGLRAA